MLEIEIGLSILSRDFPDCSEIRDRDFCCLLNETIRSFINLFMHRYIRPFVHPFIIHLYQVGTTSNSRHVCIHSFSRQPHSILCAHDTENSIETVSINMDMNIKRSLHLRPEWFIEMSTLLSFSISLKNVQVFYYQPLCGTRALRRKR